MKLFIVLIVLISSSCATSIIPVTVPLSLPPDLILPKIQGAEFQCMTEDAYNRVALRDVMLRARVDTLKDIIESTHQ